MACTAQAAGAPSIRAEGITELVGDVIINCTGGTPTPPGQPLPLINVQVFTSPSINITSRLFGDGLSEAMLFMDEPAPQDQVLCPPPGETPAPNCDPFSGTYRGNAFQARQAGANSLIWQGVPINPPGNQTERIIRITNVRVNVSQLGQGGSQQTTNISIVPFISAGPGGPAINFPVAPIPVGVIQPSVIFSVLPRSVPHCEPQNATLIAGGQLVASQQFLELRYSELFPEAFRRRNTAIPNPPDGPPPDPIAQDVLGTDYGTESGYMKARAPGAPIPVLAPVLGLADHGTRLMARFNNVQSGVQLWVETSPRISPTGGGVSTGFATLISTSVNGDGPFSPVTSTATLNTQGQQSGLARVPIIGNLGQAVWEIMNADTTSLERADVKVVFAYIANGTRPGSPLEGTSNVKMNLPPLSPFGSGLNTAPLPIPRFYQPPDLLPAAAKFPAADPALLFGRFAATELGRRISGRHRPWRAGDPTAGLGSAARGEHPRGLPERARWAT